MFPLDFDQNTDKKFEAVTEQLHRNRHFDILIFWLQESFKKIIFRYLIKWFQLIEEFQMKLHLIWTVSNLLTVPIKMVQLFGLEIDPKREARLKWNWQYDLTYFNLLRIQNTMICTRKQETYDAKWKTWWYEEDFECLIYWQIQHQCRHEMHFQARADFHDGSPLGR